MTKKKLIGLTILAVMMAFACAGEPSANHKPDAGEQSSTLPEVSTTVNDSIPASSSPVSTNSRSPVILTIDGEDYTLPCRLQIFQPRDGNITTRPLAMHGTTRFKPAYTAGDISARTILRL